jgi:predicted acyl esterase
VNFGASQLIGAIAVYQAIKPKDTDNDKVFLVMGPWHHGQEIGDGARKGDVAPVAAFEEYVSDPAKPVPFRARPIQPVGYDNGLTWSRWLVDDQREASGRPDVVVLWRASRPWASISSWCRPTSSAAAIARAWRPPNP